MKLKRITMITFLFFTVLTPIYAQTHGLYTMDVPYAFGAGYNFELKKDWNARTDGGYHTGFLTCDFRLYENQKFSIIPQISYFDIDHPHPGLDIGLIPAGYIRWTYADPIGNSKLGIFGKAGLGVSYNKFYVGSIFRQPGTKFTSRGRAGGGLFYHTDVIKLSLGLLGAGVIINEKISDTEDVTYHAYFLGEAGFEAKIAENLSLFIVSDLIFISREFSVSIGINLH